ncbi:hypothetical protein [Reichenbachiella sp.]|uniref:hypothetical protein n=1 Tax=Reichenbachiella sp. TaxID=2184521 RepID=UPI003B5CF7D5
MPEQVKYDIFTFQLRPKRNIQTHLWNENLTAEEIMDRKNGLFSQSLDEHIGFYTRRGKLNYQVKHKDDESFLFRLANKKTVHLEQEFHRESFPSEPSCAIMIWNNPDYQMIAIESDRTSFGSSKSVKNILEKALSRKLEGVNLDIAIHPNYDESDFWDLVDRYDKEVQNIKFEFEYPNLPAVNKTINETLKQASKAIRSDKTKLEFSASKGDILDNVDVGNEQLTNLVKASSEGAGSVKLKMKGYRRWETTGNNMRHEEFDSLEVDLSSEESANWVASFIERLRSIRDV